MPIAINRIDSIDIVGEYKLRESPCLDLSLGSLKEIAFSGPISFINRSGSLFSFIRNENELVISSSKGQISTVCRNAVCALSMSKEYATVLYPDCTIETFRISVADMKVASLFYANA